MAATCARGESVSADLQIELDLLSRFTYTFNLISSSFSSLMLQFQLFFIV